MLVYLGKALENNQGETFHFKQLLECGIRVMEPKQANMSAENPLQISFAGLTGTAGMLQ